MNEPVGQNTSLTSIVFPLPGGPNKSKPRAGALRPVKSWTTKYGEVFNVNPKKQKYSEQRQNVRK